jgi:hypothetical protein
MLTYSTLNEIDGSAKSVIKDLAELERDLKERMKMAEKMGTQFTCFTSTKIQILTQKAEFICFTGTEVQILTPEELQVFWCSGGLYACTMYGCPDVCMYVCMYAFMYVCMHVCMYACMYVCILTLSLCRCYGAASGGLV